MVNKRKGLKLIPFTKDVYGPVVAMIEFQGTLFVATSEGVFRKTDADNLEPLEMLVIDDQ